MAAVQLHHEHARAEVRFNSVSKQGLRGSRAKACELCAALRCRGGCHWKLRTLFCTYSHADVTRSRMQLHLRPRSVRGGGAGRQADMGRLVVCTDACFSHGRNQALRFDLARPYTRQALVCTAQLCSQCMFN